MQFFPQRPKESMYLFTQTVTTFIQTRLFSALSDVDPGI